MKKYPSLEKPRSLISKTEFKSTVWICSFFLLTDKEIIHIVANRVVNVKSNKSENIY